MVIMAILLTLATINIGSSQAHSRDDERNADTTSIARGLEARYRNGNPLASAGWSLGPGTYPGVNELLHASGQSVSGFSPVQVTDGYLEREFTGTTDKTFSAPGRNSIDLIPVCSSSCGAAGNTTTIEALTTVNTYVYEPVDTSNQVCMNGGCVRYNLYWRGEADGGALHTIVSEHQ